MPDQLELVAEPRPKASAEDVSQMVYWLAQIGEWATADQILKWMGKPLSEANRRRIRAAAEASAGVIASGPGTPGYKLTRLVTPEELHLVEGLRTQASRMLNRYLEITRVWHKHEERRHA